MNIKKCKRCGIQKGVDSFWRGSRTKDGYRASCKECLNNTNGRRVSTLYWHALKRAKRLNIPFTITRTDIKIPEHCPVLGIKLEHGKNIMCESSPTIDRIIPHLGYTPGNIAVISARANRIKSDATVEELEKILAFMRTH
jgi:hypothetical protein